MEKDLLAQYRPIPFWSWNDKLNPETLIEQIRWMKQMGLGGFFMHARAGLQTQYLSEEWFRCIEVGADEAQAQAMRAWVYDENGWPSGFVGGKLLQAEENHDWLIESREGAFDAQATVSYFTGADELVRVSEPISDALQYLNLYLRMAASTVDILNPDVVEQFLSLTHAEYQKRFGDDFSKKIAGFFTDEPQYQRWGTPYTKQIALYFRENYGEDIFDGLGLLFVEKSGYRRFRYRYWKGMQELMLHSYSERVYRWCQANGVRFTGHYIEETSLGYQLMCCGGVMPFYEYMDIPGIDWLGKNTDASLSAVQVASVAAQLGKKQVLTETFACCGWDVKPAELRRVAGYQYVHGINLLCYHLIPYSERGTRKYDYPAHYSAINPWISDGFRTFNDYFSRLGYLLGEGEQHVSVAVLHPIRSAYFSYQRALENSGFGVAALDEALHSAAKLLERHGIAYHYLDETLLAKYGFVENAAIGCGNCKYTYLILPKLLTMDASTEKLLRQFVSQGGKVLLLDEKPAYLEAEPFDYPYLESNCTLHDILRDMPFRVEATDTDLCYAYRTMGERKYLYVINPSQTQTFSQKFDFGESVRSFTRVHLQDLSTQQIALSVTLQPGEDALLFCSTREAEKPRALQPYSFRFTQATVEFSQNALIVDCVSYSYDGIHYSKPWPCPALFQKLLKDRFAGRIFLRYAFEIEQVPESILLQSESSHDLRAWINGIPLTEKLPSRESYETLYDISKHVKLGINHYTVSVLWHEDASVYRILFAKDATEGLKNCIAYDSELQPIYLLGKFGVYPKSGYRDTEPNFVEADDFYIGKVPETVSDITTDGFPFFSGQITLCRTFDLARTDVSLHLLGEYQSAEVTINGTDKGRLLFDTQMDISDVAVLGTNTIRVRFQISNRNRMGPHHMVGGKTWGVSPWSFEMFGSWNDDKSDAYHDGYDLKLFYAR